jgi:ATP-binding cassette subfamily B protein
MLKLLKKLSKKDIFVVFICLLLIFAQVWLELKMPDYMSAITQLVQTEGSQMQEILENGAYMLLCAFGSLVAAIFTRIFNFKCFSKIFV